MLDVDDGGALGVVLNRPSGVPVAEVLETWGEIASEPEVLFRGGPVSTEGALGVALLRDERRRPGRLPRGRRACSGWSTWTPRSSW